MILLARTRQGWCQYTVNDVLLLLAVDKCITRSVLSSPSSSSHSWPSLLQYSDGKLYNQLLYFDGLFNTDSAKERVGGTSRFGSFHRASLERCENWFEQPWFAIRLDEIQALSEQNRSALAQLKSAVQKHLDKNGRRWVGMKTLFSFMKIKS